jgi:hypothetical protein
MNDVYKCKHCDKTYKSRSSRSNHIKRIHKTNDNRNIIIDNPVDNHPIINNNIKEAIEYLCRKCNKSFEFYQNRWRHEKKCKIDENNKIKEIENIIKMKELEDKVKKLEKLIEKSSNMNNCNINNGNITNNINNININALGYESINSKLTEQEKIDLLTCHLFKEVPHVELIRKIYNNEKFLEDRNTMITNLQTKSCLVYNNKTKKFEAKNKNQHIDNLIDYRQKDIKEMYMSMQNNKKFKKISEKFENTILNKNDKEEIIYIIYNRKEIMKKLKADLDNAENNTDDDEDDYELSDKEIIV